MADEIAVFEDENEAVGVGEGDAERSIQPTDPKWADFVMEHFTSEELVDIDGRQHPNVAGLRRVVELLMGDVVQSRIDKFVPFDNKRATVSYILEIQPYNLGGGQTKLYGDIADVSSDNADPYFFQKFALTTAATRAEGRCLRKALKLRVAAAEEMDRSKNQKPVDVKPEVETNKSISESQITFIDKKCKELDISVKKFINAGKQSFPDINDVPEAKAKQMVKQINVYVNDSTKIPESLLGYNEHWRS